MGRPRRVHRSNALVHVTQQCHNGVFLLRRPEDRDLYLAVVSEVALAMSYLLLSFCIQESHIHLLLQTPVTIDGYTLSAFMHRVNTTFGKRYNKRHRRLGTVWSGRFHDQWLTGASAAKRLVVLWYIESNTARRKQGAVPPEQWRWCGAYWVLNGLSCPWANHLAAEVRRLLGRFPERDPVAAFRALLARSHPRWERLAGSLDGLGLSPEHRRNIQDQFAMGVRQGAIPRTPSWIQVVECHSQILANLLSAS